MTYCENLTNRKLLKKAMPLMSLSRKEWNELLNHIEDIEREQSNSILHKALITLHNNQAKIEVKANYFDYYFDILDEPVREKAVEVFIE